MPRLLGFAPLGNVRRAAISFVMKGETTTKDGRGRRPLKGKKRINVGSGKGMSQAWKVPVLPSTASRKDFQYVLTGLPTETSTGQFQKYVWIVDREPVDRIAKFYRGRRKAKVTAQPVTYPIQTVGTPSDEDGIVSIPDRVKKLGIVSGQKLSVDEASESTKRIIDSSLDLFGTVEAAREFLMSDNFDDTGVSGVQLIQSGRVSRVLSRLDDMRFGFRG